MPNPIRVDRATAALELQVRDPDTITRYIERGWLKAVRVGRRVLIDRASLDRLLREGRPHR